MVNKFDGFFDVSAIAAIRGDAAKRQADSEFMSRMQRKPWEPPERKPRTTPSWNQIRSQILDMDDYQCRICFTGSHVARLHVHHMDYDRTNNKLANLVTLCETCHRHIHREGYKPADHDDWPTPWKIARSDEQ